MAPHADTFTSRTEAAPLHPALRWRFTLDPTGLAHRCHPVYKRRRSACGVIGRLVLAENTAPRCPECFRG